MNTLEHTVTKVLGPPALKYGAWFVSVLADCWGRVDETEIMFSNEQAARQCAPGYRFEQ